MKRLAVVVLACLSLGACAGLDPGYIAFVKADRLTKSAIGAEWLQYMQADASKTEQQKSDAAKLLELWERDLQAAEARIGAQ